VTRVLRALAVGALAIPIAAGCEGQGDSGDGLEIDNAPIAPNCTPAAGQFPSGLAVLSQSSRLAALVQFDPPGVAVYQLDAERPALLGSRNFGTDSDADGVADKAASAFLFPAPINGVRPEPGEIQALGDHLSLTSTSNYEQLLTYDPSNVAPVGVIVQVPAAVPVGRYPLLPAPGTGAVRTGISTFACIAPDPALDSTGLAIPPDPRCDAGTPSFLTSFTAGKAVAAGRLFVATSNFVTGSRYRPGTVLVYDWSEVAGQIAVSPSVDIPVLFTTGFNPTGLVRHVTAGGRELVLVTVTGALGPAPTGHRAVTEAAVDVIDPSVPRIAATIPLGLAGAGFEAAALDPSAQIALLGSAVRRELYAVDLRALDDPRLYANDGDRPVILDGLTAGFPDARIFDADAPLVLPDRIDRPSTPDCKGFTYVTTNDSGSEAYATDFCDGTFTRIRLDLGGAPPIPFSAQRFQLAGQTAPFAPNTAIGELHFPSIVMTRPGRPGVDFTSPDVLVLVGQPDAQLCTLRVESH
jgi:hypothetical protein